MRFFWPTYIALAVAGTAGAYIAAPLAKPYLPAFLFPERTAAAEEQTDGGAATASQPSSTAPAARRPAEPPPAPRDLSATDVQLVRGSETPTWGVTLQESAYYNTKGNRLGTLPGGTLVGYKSKVSSSSGVMIECVRTEEGANQTPFLVKRDNLRLYSGSLKTLPAQELKAILAFYTLNGKIEARRSEITKTAAERNPYFKSYQTAHTAYTKQIEQAKTLTQQRDKATDAERMRLERQLGEMKMSEERLKAKLLEEQQKYRDWKEKNAASMPKPENDATIRTWENEMANIRSQVSWLVY